MTNLTQLLDAVAQGQKPVDDLLEVVYDDLRKMAAAKLARERPGQTLQATALVNEAYLRLTGGGANNEPKWENRKHFFAAAAKAMRRILVERARKKKLPKASSDDDLMAIIPGKSVSPDDILGVHEALDELATIDAEVARLVELHFFVGLSLMECSEVMGISDRTARRHWVFARTWLFKKLGGKGVPPE